MPIRVLDIDLAVPPDGMAIDMRDYSEIHVVTRYHGQPLGDAWLRGFPNRPFGVTTELYEEIVRQVQWPLTLELLRELLHEGGRGSDAPTHVAPPVTVVVPTRNRAPSLRRALRSLAALDYPSDQMDVVVVDNAPIDASTLHVVQEFGGRFRYVTEPRPGVEWARNRGIAEAKTAIIAFTDDDVEVDQHWLTELVEQFDDPYVAGVTGLIVPAQRETDAQNIFEELGGFGKGYERRYYSDAIQKIWPFPANIGILGTGANLAFRTSIVRGLGGFDPTLGSGSLVGGGGDLDMLYRVIRAGHGIVYQPRALIRHYHRADLDQLERQLANYASGVYGLFTKIFVTDPPMRGRVLSFGIYWFFRHFVWNLVAQGQARRRLWGKQVIGAIAAPFRYYRSVQHVKHLSQTDVPTFVSDERNE